MSGIAGSIINLVGSVITTGGSVANTIINKDAYEANARATELRAQENLELTKRNNKITLVIVVALVLIISIIVLRK